MLGHLIFPPLVWLKIKLQIKTLRGNNAIQETFAPQLFIIVADESRQQNLGGDGQSLLFISQTVSEDNKC